MKKTVSVLLAVLLSSVLILPVFAADNEEETAVLFAASEDETQDTIVLVSDENAIEPNSEEETVILNSDEAPDAKEDQPDVSIVTIDGVDTITTIGALTHVVDLSSGYYWTEDQKAQLEAKAQTLSDDFDMDIVILVTDDPGDKTPEAYADDYYDNMGYGRGDDKDGVLFLRCMQSRDWYVSTCGRGITVFSDDVIDYIIEQMTESLRADDLYSAFSVFLNESETCLKAESEGVDYSERIEAATPKRKPFAFTVLGIVFAVGLGFLLSLIPMGKLKREVYNVSFKSGAADYTKPNSLNLRNSNDIYLYTNTTRVRIQTESSSSRSGGGHTHVSSSGMTHGGHGGKI